MDLTTRHIQCLTKRIVSAVDMSEVLEESQVMEVLQQLDQELVGLKSVKTRIREIAALLLIDRMRRVWV